MNACHGGCIYPERGGGCWGCPEAERDEVGTCHACGEAVCAGDEYYYADGTGYWYHRECVEGMTYYDLIDAGLLSPFEFIEAASPDEYWE